MGVGDEVLAAVVHLLLAELYGGKGRVEREGAAVVSGSDGAQAGLHVELTHRGVVAEAVGLLVELVGDGTVEVLAHQLVSLLEVAVGKGLTDFGEQVSRLLVDVPIVVGTLGGIGTSSPEALLVEGDAFGLDGAHDVGSQVAVADGEGDLFPFGSIAGTPGILVDVTCSGLPELLLAVVPGQGALQRCGCVKPDG